MKKRELLNKIVSAIIFFGCMTVACCAESIADLIFPV